MSHPSPLGPQHKSQQSSVYKAGFKLLNTLGAKVTKSVSPTESNWKVSLQCPASGTEKQIHACSAPLPAACTLSNHNKKAME